MGIADYALPTKITSEKPLLLNVIPLIGYCYFILSKGSEFMTRANAKYVLGSVVAIPKYMTSIQYLSEISQYQY